MTEYSRSFAIIDLGKIRNNMLRVKQLVPKETKIMAVVKADGYGHGAVEVGRKLESIVDYFGVADVEEALELREAGIKLPILILGYSSPSEYEILIKNDIAQTIYSMETASAFSKECERLKKTGKIHIALDTGMSRIGFKSTREDVELVKKIKKLPMVELEGLFTHFSCADMEEKEYTYLQMKRFDEFVMELEKEGIQIPLKHTCNSAAIMEFDHHRYDMVRSGIITYGMYPSDEVDKARLFLEPAFTLKAHVGNVHFVEKGSGISYGATFVAKEKMKIATLTFGYADGYPRSLSSIGRVIIKGQYAPILGRVCMDQMMVDVSHIEDVRVEDEVTLIGTDGEAQITMEEVGNLSGSFNYELSCRFTRRVKRIYINES